MGGVELIDGLIGRYTISVKSNKFTNRLFTYMLDLVMVNAYILFHQINKPDANNKKHQLPNFRSKVAYVLCKVQRSSLTNGLGSQRQVENAKSYIGKKTFLPSNDVRYDGVKHFPIFISRAGKKTCKLPSCTSVTQIVCRKCNTNLSLSQQKDFLRFSSQIRRRTFCTTMLWSFVNLSYVNFNCYFFCLTSFSLFTFLNIFCFPKDTSRQSKV